MIVAGFPNLKNLWRRTQIRIQKFWNRSGVGVWKCDGMVWFHAFLWLKSRNNTKQQEEIQWHQRSL